MKTTLQILIIATALAALGIRSVNAEGKRNPNPGIIPPQASYASKTQGEWLQEWWNWVGGAEGSPQMYDGTGEAAYVNGNGNGKVFFLAKTWAAVPQERQISIRAGTALFIPVMGMMGDPIFWGISDPEELKSAVLDTVPYAEGLAVTINGRGVKNIWDYFQTTGFFTSYDVNYEPYYFDNSFSWEVILLLAPLPPGQHVIHMQGAYPPWDFASDVTYYITVEPRKQRR
jgi:hypothetical protein